MATVGDLLRNRGHAGLSIFYLEKCLPGLEEVLLTPETLRPCLETGPVVCHVVAGSLDSANNPDNLDNGAGGATEGAGGVTEGTGGATEGTGGATEGTGGATDPSHGFAFVVNPVALKRRLGDFKLLAYIYTLAGQIHR